MLFRSIDQTAEELRLDPADDAALEMMVNEHSTLAKVLLDQHEAEKAREHAAQALAFYARRSDTARASTYNLLEAAQAHHLAGHAWLQTAARDRVSPAVASSDRAKSCAEFITSADLARQVKDVPQAPGEDEYDLSETQREAAACRGRTG